MDNTLSLVQQQLKLLGYRDDELVFARPAAKAYVIEPQPLSQELIDKLVLENNQGKSIYFVVNGQGHKDRDINSCRAIFMEHDDRLKDEQVELWKEFKLPEPTFQIDTGGKSIHTYWTLKEPISIDAWKSLITDLINYTGADKANKNPSRILRLVGFKHHKTTKVAKFVSKSGETYSYDELRQLIPVSQSSKVFKTKSKKKAVNTKSQKNSLALKEESCFVRSGKNYTCPICDNNENRNCATTVNDRGVREHFCYYKQEGAPAKGFQFNRQSSNGVWGVFVSEDAAAVKLTPEEKAAKDRQRQRELAKLPTILERDDFFITLVDKLDLKDDDRDLLHRKGLTDEDLEIMEIRSVRVGAKIESKAPLDRVQSKVVGRRSPKQPN